ncbi:hypothetical protein BDL97_01G123900 [Sphagnum fallax]|jgi:hypothetical protein|uniref:Uncharacterized protein n=1 Tax=Sphagnum jensenii TaxID=128206 RepID=A0ABP0VQM6_9BRYO|nr:hypothetical protein BDL97_01G123900 [Sphagnum fallax]
MGSLARLARISAWTGAAALIGMEASVLYSHNDEPSSESRKNCHAQEQKTADQQCSKHEKQSKPVQIKCTPKMAPQFDGLNFYETFIPSQR